MGIHLDSRRSSYFFVSSLFIVVEPGCYRSILFIIWLNYYVDVNNNPVTLSYSYTSSPYPDFSSGESAGVRVVRRYDTTTSTWYDCQELCREGNVALCYPTDVQESCFYEADTTQLNRTANQDGPFDDAFVSFARTGDGWNVVPYLPPAFFDGYSDAGGCQPQQKVGYDFNAWYKFGSQWFQHKNTYNWYQVIGRATRLSLGLVQYAGMTQCPKYGDLRSQVIVRVLYFAEP